MIIIIYLIVLQPGGRIQFDSYGKVKAIPRSSGSATVSIDWVEGTSVAEEGQDRYEIASDGSVQVTSFD
jgi:hypothetical protein